jgi:hypothetical protein
LPTAERTPYRTVGFLGNSLPMYALSCERVCRPDSDTGNLVTEPLSSNGRPLRFRYSGFQRHATMCITVRIMIFMLYRSDSVSMETCSSHVPRKVASACSKLCHLKDKNGTSIFTVLIGNGVRGTEERKWWMKIRTELFSAELKRALVASLCWY